MFAAKKSVIVHVSASKGGNMSATGAALLMANAFAENSVIEEATWYLTRCIAMSLMLH